MSKGLGTFQQNLIEALSNKTILLNELLWQKAEESNSIEYNSELKSELRYGFIKKSFHNKCLRAIKTLKKRKIVSIEKKRILSLDEMIHFYPFKTNKVEIRKLRTRLLPLLKDYIEQHPYEKVFSDPEVELHTVEEILKNDFSGKQFRQDWSLIETRAKTNFNIDKEDSDDILYLIMKGKSLFNKKVEIDISLGEIIADCVHNEILKHHSPLLLKQIVEFYAKYFYNEEHKRNIFKNQLYSVIQIGRNNGASSVLEKVKEYFLEKDTEFIKSLPGTKIAEKRKGGWYTIGDYIETNTFSPLLDKFIDRHLLKDFIFLSSLPKYPS